MNNVFAITNHFKAHVRAEFFAPPGTPLMSVFAEALYLTDTDPIMLRAGYVEVNDTQIPKSEWMQTTIGIDDRVVIIGGMGGDFGGLLLQVASIALAAIVPPIGGLAFAGFNVGQVLVRAGITIGASLLAQSLAPSPSRPNLPGNEPIEARFSISGTRNQILPYGLVPRVYGRIKNYHPPLAAQPYTHVFGADNHALTMLFCIGEGDIQVTSLFIGDQPIGQLPGLTSQIREDVTFAQMPTLYPGRVTKESLSIQLKQTTSYHLRRSPDDTNEIFLEVFFPNGLGRLTDRNIKFGISVQFQVQYRPIGGSWIDAPITSAAGATIDGSGLFTISGFYKAAVRRAVKFTVSNGQYDVRIRRLTIDDQSVIIGENQSQTWENSFWSGARFFDNRRPIEREGVTLLAIRAQATDSLNGVIDQLSCTVESRIPVWNGSSWSNQYTRNPAWVFADILRGEGNSDPIADSRIDLAQLLTWANQCDTWGIKFDGAFNFDISIWDALNEAATVGRASPLIKDGIYSVFIDRPESTPVQLITTRNSWNASGSRVFIDAPHALKVRFPNELTKGQIDEIIVYADGFSESNATKFEGFEFAWTTNADRAWKEARVFMAKAVLRNEIFSRTMDIEHIRFHRGDYVLLQDDVMLVGLHAARVKALALPDVTLDAPLSFTMDVGENYTMLIRHENGTIYTEALTSDVSATNVVEALSLSADDVEVGDLVAIGITEAVVFDAIVRSIEPQSDLSANVTLLPAAFDLYAAINGTIPPFDPGITLPPPLIKDRPPKPQITSVRADERALIGTGYEAQTAIALGLLVETSAEQTTPEVMQIRYRVYTYATVWTYLTLPWYATEASLTPVETGEEYEIEARTVNEFGLSSDWARVTILVTGKTNPPPDVERFYRQGDSLTWPYPDPPADFVGFKLRSNVGTSTNIVTAQEVVAGVLTSPPFDISNFSGTHTFLLTAIDSVGNESLIPARLTINLGDALVENLILKQDEDATGYPGVIVDATVNGTDLEADSDTNSVFWGSDASIFWGADGAVFWGTTTYKPFTYTATYSPIANHIGATVHIDLTAVGDASIQYREFVSESFWGAGGSAFWGADGDPFWDDSIISEFLPFPGLLGPIIATTESYEFLISIGATTNVARGEITNLDLLIDVPDIEESFQDFVVANSGTVRLPITKTYRVIQIVNMTLQDDGGTAEQLLIIDKNPTLGPEIQAKTGGVSGSRVSATIDATIKGY